MLKSIPEFTHNEVCVHALKHLAKPYNVTHFTKKIKCFYCQNIAGVAKEVTILLYRAYSNECLPW